MVLDGKVPYDPRNHAIYPAKVHDKKNIEISAGVEIFVKILETVQQLRKTSTMAQLRDLNKICFISIK